MKTEKLKLFVKENKKKIIIGAIGLASVACGYVIFRNSREPITFDNLCQQDENVNAWLRLIEDIDELKCGANGYFPVAGDEIIQYGGGVDTIKGPGGITGKIVSGIIFVNSDDLC